MKLRLDKKEYKLNPVLLLRKAGYGIIHDRQRDKSSYVRHLGRGRYPRFHSYVDDNADAIVVNLHLDQKAASYSGAHAHNAEYDGEAVNSEMMRIKGIAHDFLVSAEQIVEKEVEKNWWQKLFS